MADEDELLAAFKNAINIFNDAPNSTPKNYDKFRNCLYDKVIIDKVDDSDYVDNTRDFIVDKYLNPNEATPPNPKFPQFSPQLSPGSPPPKAYVHNNKPVGAVIGDGYYWDTLANFNFDRTNGNNPPKKAIKVHYTLRFKKKQNDWLLTAALVVPIGPIP